ncbi:hypothetical protein JL107_03355 [Nakamurella flavida]|uniref:DUF3558 domain-containing protein n=1 Tax=Nakamurella flavida TaxID=363630 RepID=A0A938YLJ2_9ACTN|nr:hypothetical protein [Nakamurella flavida]MBM9475474.1 hypothetical protein [Nakamurella flavida]MDP9777018.1 hypothetical protein [Nakamurella flavida]
MLNVLPLALAAGLVLSACGAPTETRRTVTVDATVTGSPAAPATGTDASGTAVTVPSDGTATSGDPATGTGSTETPASGASTSDSAATSPAASSSAPATSAAPVQVVDPLKNDCAALLNAADVKRELNADIADTRGRIVDVANPDRGITGRIKCLYGLGADGKTGDVTVNLTQFADAAAATAQVDLTVTTESGLGARVSDAAVAGYPGHVLLREGGLFLMQYDTWTLSIVVANGKADDATLAAGLPKLAETVLARVLKNG